MYTILHIDNSTFFKKILEEVAFENQFNLISVTNPDNALKIIEDTKLDLIITGLEFKGMTGLQFINYLNKNVKYDVSKVILTSNDTVELRKKAEELGVMDVIQKDISLNSLFTFIERIKNMNSVKIAFLNMKIAVIESNNDTCEILSNILHREGVTNIEFFEKFDSLKTSNKKYSLYIIDTTRIGRDAEKMIIDIRRENMNAIVIAISEDYDSENLSNLLLAGADDFVVQPLNRKVFMARVNANVRLLIHREEIENKNLQLEKINLELNRLVITDGLTGLFNRSFVMESLEIQIDNASRYNRNLSLMMFDIDHFKAVNDTYGHQVGDLVLTEISKEIKKNTRKSDIVGRYGGEEFLVILPETDLESGIKISEKIRKIVEKLEFEIEGLRVTISCGICARANENIAELIHKADDLLYLAKHSGRNQTAYKII